MRKTAVLAFASAFVLGANAAELPSRIVTQPNLEVSLFAMEPDIVDPVALCFDAAGRMYVVEMRDYPYGIPPQNKPGGTVRLLEDTDNDGRADRSVVFAENLSFPTSIAPHRDGVIVTAPPEIIYLKDTDADGKADVREVLYRGFRRGVTDGNMSGLRWGLDNWLHGVNGGPGGTVTSTRKSGQPLRLGALDFRLQPDTDAIETTFSTGGGFGLVFDQWGRSFTPHNINHMQMRIIEARYLARNPGLPPTGGTESISDHGEMARIYPISEAQTRPNHPEQAGYFSASGGVGFIGHENYPGNLPGSVTVCDVVGNLVHRDVIRPNGAILRASRAPAEQESEFIASTDIHFRPTGLELGPDGALYLMDMHRAVIEHPDYIPKKMLETMDIREGDDQGRIYRVFPKQGVKQSQQKPATMSPAELVEELRSPNQWRRMTAQRLLVEGGTVSIVDALKHLAVSDANPQARVHALWTLEGLESLDSGTLGAVLQDEDNADGVLENALQIAAARPDADLPRRRYPDRSIRVRALANMLQGEPDAAMAQFLVDAGDDQWARLHAFSSIRTNLPGLALRMITAPAFSEGTGSGTDATFELLGEMTGATLRSEDTRTLGQIAEELGTVVSSSALRLGFLKGLDTGLQRNRNRFSDPQTFSEVTQRFSGNATPEMLLTVWSIEQKLGLPDSESKRNAITRATTQLKQGDVDDATRIASIQTIALAPTDRFVGPLLSLFEGRHSLAVQRAALDVLEVPTDIRIADGLLGRWRTIHPSLKQDVMKLMVTKKPYHDPLLTRLENGDIQVGELNLDLEDRRRLLRWSTSDIHARAEKLLGDGEYGNRQAKVDEWLAQLPEEGNPNTGRTVFEEACALCHRVGNLGFEVGPNLTGQSHRSVEDLVSNIIDPNMAINPNYFSVSVETKDGELHTGILTAETPDAVTLLQAQGIKSTLNRSDITRFESTGTSLMPEGLEATMTPQLMRDLVAFLKE